MNFVKAIVLLESSQPFSKTTAESPSFLIEVLGKTTLQRTLENFKKLGFGEVVLVAEKEVASARAVKDAAASLKKAKAPWAKVSVRSIALG